MNLIFYTMAMGKKKNKLDFVKDTIEMKSELKVTSCQPPHSLRLAKKPLEPHRAPHCK